MSQNLVKKIRLVQNSHKFLSRSLGCGKETLQREAGIEMTFLLGSPYIQDKLIV